MTGVASDWYTLETIEEFGNWKRYQYVTCEYTWRLSHYYLKNNQKINTKMIFV